MDGLRQKYIETYRNEWEQIKIDSYRLKCMKMGGNRCKLIDIDRKRLKQMEI